MDLVNESGLEAAWIVSKISPPAFSLTAVIKGTFQLRPGDTALLADEQLSLTGDEFESDDPSKPLRYPFDFAPFKPRADALLVGTCHAPEGRPATVARVGFQIGSLSKSLEVHGDRYRGPRRFWVGPRRATEPEPFTALPLSWERAYGGPGFKRNPLGKGFKPIELEDGNRVIPLPNIESQGRSKLEPAGFGPIPDTWPQRLKKFGKPNSRYKKELWPWYPKNFDWGFFNTAPEDQQIEGYLQGDEEFCAENLHPTTSLYRSRLPGLRVRCFLNERVRAHQELREIPVRLDTLWIDLDAEMLVLVWRGHVVVHSEKLLEVEHLLVATEPLNEAPEDEEHFDILLDEVLARREEEEEEELEEEEEEEEEEQEEEEAAAAASAGGTGEADQTKTDAEEEEEEEDEEEEEETPDDEDTLTVERVKEMIAQRLRLAMMPKVKAAEAVFAEADLSDANLEEADLTEADLCDARLHRTDFTRADLTDAALENSWGRHVKATGAVLRKVRAAGASMCEADFRESVAVESVWESAQLYAADFTRAVLDGAEFSGAYLSEAVFDAAEVRKARFEEANLRRAHLHRCNLYETSLGQADLTGANLSESNLFGATVMDSVLDNTDFTGANLRRVKAKGKK